MKYKALQSIAGRGFSYVKGQVYDLNQAKLKQAGKRFFEPVKQAKKD